MIPDRMTRPLKVASTSLCLAAAALSIAACGTQKISVPTSDAAAHAGAVLFNQRCGGCHTLSYAATHGSAANIRDRQPINGPDFSQRCERPVQRVLYAIENGGFSGAYMPQNIVVGEQAREVAMFVSKYAGRQAPPEPGQTPCVDQQIGTLPPANSEGVPLAAAPAAAGTSTSASTSTAATSTGSTATPTATTSSTSTAPVTGGAAPTATATTAYK
jgi:mono/diheme cytochrome c family protein